MSSDAERLEAMETRLAFQEHTLQELSDALIAQQTRMDRLEARLALLAEQVPSGPEEGEGAPEPPPHY